MFIQFSPVVPSIYYSTQGVAMNNADRVVGERVRRELIKATADKKLKQAPEAQLRSQINTEIGPALARLKAKSYEGAVMLYVARTLMNSDFGLGGVKRAAWKVHSYTVGGDNYATIIYFTSNGRFLYSGEKNNVYTSFNLRSYDLEGVLSGLRSL